MHCLSDATSQKGVAALLYREDLLQNSHRHLSANALRKAFVTLKYCLYPYLLHLEVGKEAFVEQHPNLERILFSEDEIRTRVKEMGAQITEDYAGKSIVVISVLRGAAIFMADLVREIHLPVEMDYMAISSYGNGMKSSGVVRIIKDLSSQMSTVLTVVMQLGIPVGVGALTLYVEKVNRKTILIVTYVLVAILGPIWAMLPTDQPALAQSELRSRKQLGCRMA